jgi:hypothetical protein
MGIMYDVLGRELRGEEVAEAYRNDVLEFVTGEILYHEGVHLPIARNVISIARNFTNFL